MKAMAVLAILGAGVVALATSKSATPQKVKLENGKLYRLFGHVTPAIPDSSIYAFNTMIESSGLGKDASVHNTGGQTVFETTAMGFGQEAQPGQVMGALLAPDVNRTIYLDRVEPLKSS